MGGYSPVESPGCCSYADKVRKVQSFGSEKSWISWATSVLTVGGQGAKDKWPCIE